MSLTSLHVHSCLCNSVNYNTETPVASAFQPLSNTEHSWTFNFIFSNYLGFYLYLLISVSLCMLVYVCGMYGSQEVTGVHSLNHLGLETELGLSGTAASSPLPTESFCEPINISVIQIITVCIQTLTLNHSPQINV